MFSWFKKKEPASRPNIQTLKNTLYVAQQTARYNLADLEEYNNKVYVLETAGMDASSEKSMVKYYRGKVDNQNRIIEATRKVLAAREKELLTPSV